MTIFSSVATSVALLKDVKDADVWDEKELLASAF